MATNTETPFTRYRIVDPDQQVVWFDDLVSPNMAETYLGKAQADRPSIAWQIEQRTLTASPWAPLSDDPSSIVTVPTAALAGLLAAYSTVTAPRQPSPQRMADAIAGGDNAYDTLKALLDEAES